MLLTPVLWRCCNLQWCSKIRAGALQSALVCRGADEFSRNDNDNTRLGTQYNHASAAPVTAGGVGGVPAAAGAGAALRHARRLPALPVRRLLRWASPSERLQGPMLAFPLARGCINLRQLWYGRKVQPQAVVRVSSDASGWRAPLEASYSACHPGSKAAPSAEDLLHKPLFCCRASAGRQGGGRTAAQHALAAPPAPGPGKRSWRRQRRRRRDLMATPI